MQMRAGNTSIVVASEGGRERAWLDWVMIWMRSYVETREDDASVATEHQGACLDTKCTKVCDR